MRMDHWPPIILIHFVRIKDHGCVEAMDKYDGQETLILSEAKFTALSA